MIPSTSHISAAQRTAVMAHVTPTPSNAYMYRVYYSHRLLMEKESCKAILLASDHSNNYIPERIYYAARVILSKETNTNLPKADLLYPTYSISPNMTVQAAAELKESQSPIDAYYPMEYVHLFLKQAPDPLWILQRIADTGNQLLVKDSISHFLLSTQPFINETPLTRTLVRKLGDFAIFDHNLSSGTPECISECLIGINDHKQKTVRIYKAEKYQGDSLKLCPFEQNEKTFIFLKSSPKETSQTETPSPSGQLVDYFPTTSSEKTEGELVEYVATSQ